MMVAKQDHHLILREESSPRFCSKHKEPGMIDVRNKKCEYDGCKTRPSFNIEGELYPEDFVQNIKNQE